MHIVTKKLIADAYSNEYLRVDTWNPISAEKLACYFCNRTEMSKEQQYFYNDGMLGCVQRWFLAT